MLNGVVRRISEIPPRNTALPLLLSFDRERWKEDERVSAQLCPPLCQTMDPPARLFCPWNSPGKNTGMGSHSLLQRSFPDSRIKLRSPALQADSSPSEPPGKTREGKVSGQIFSFSVQNLLWRWLSPKLYSMTISPTSDRAQWYYRSAEVDLVLEPVNSYTCKLWQ